MGAGRDVDGRGKTVGAGGVPWLDVLLAAIAAVSWSLIGMAGTAALGLHLLEADSAGSLGPMTAAVVVLGAGGSVTPSGDVSAFGLTGAQTATAIEITPLGVSLVGALLLSWFFLRSLRTAGVAVAPAELLARVGSVVALFVAMLGGLAWAGHDVITLDGSSLGLDDLPGGGGGGLEVPGLGDIGGLLPDRLGDLVDARAAVGFGVDTAPTLLGGLGWSLGILLIALLASRRTPLPQGWDPVHRVVRPAASAVVTVLLVAVAAGSAAAAYAAVGDDHPRRIAGAALLGAPNGVWLGVPLGLFVPWDGRATGALTDLLPHPVDDLLRVGAEQPVTLGRLAELDGRVWLLGVATALMMLLAGVLTAVRTPTGAAWTGGGASSVGAVGAGAETVGTETAGAETGQVGVGGFVARCALRLGVVTALALLLLVRLTEVSVNASLSVLGFDAFGAGVELHGRPGTALLLGGAWGAGAGAAGALLARFTGAAGRWAWAAETARGDAGRPRPTTRAAGRARPDHGSPGESGDPAGPYAPSVSYRPPNPATNPYLRVPDELRDPQEPTEPQDARPGATRESGTGPSGPYGSSRRDEPPPGPDDVYGAPTVVRPMGPSPRSSRRPAGPRPGPRPGERPPTGPEEGPPPPPPPPPPAPPRGPRTPRGPR
ncbi:streptophobe family protein [Streptomyces sp. SAS_272]|uniref:streptophobe family protein n=1 Tax=Streptomyces sp. SAS_272 TaxID=3412747 RepID=UPI00403CB116